MEQRWISRPLLRVLWVRHPSPEAWPCNCIQAGHVKFYRKRSNFFAIGMFVGTIRSEIQPPWGLQPQKHGSWGSQARPAKKYRLFSIVCPDPFTRRLLATLAINNILAITFLTTISNNSQALTLFIEYGKWYFENWEISAQYFSVPMNLFFLECSALRVKHFSYSSHGLFFIENTKRYLIYSFGQLVATEHDSGKKVSKIEGGEI